MVQILDGDEIQQWGQRAQRLLRGLLKRFGHNFKRGDVGGDFLQNVIKIPRCIKLSGVGGQVLGQSRAAQVLPPRAAQPACASSCGKEKGQIYVWPELFDRSIRNRLHHQARTVVAFQPMAARHMPRQIFRRHQDRARIGLVQRREKRGGCFRDLAQCFFCRFDREIARGDGEILKVVFQEHADVGRQVLCICA